MSETSSQRGGGIGRWTQRHRARLGLSARIVTAGLATYAAAHLLGFAQSYWAVLTAVIVMQASVGGSIQATLDRLAGSLGGAVWGVAVCLAVPHASVAGLGIALAIALAPLAVVTAFWPAWRIASITAIILLLTPTSQAAGPVAAAAQRMLEVGLGSLIAVLVALVLAPGRSHGALARAAATALAAMAELTPLIMAGLAHARDPLAVEGIHARIRAAIVSAETAADDARRERAVSLAATVDPEPLCRTLRRVQHDLVMIGRATVTPLPEPARTAMAGPAENVGLAVARFLGECGSAIARRAPAPSQAETRESLAAFGAAVADLRVSGVTRELPDDAVARLFGLTFGFEQLGANLDDLTARAAELADHGPTAARR